MNLKKNQFWLSIIILTVMFFTLPVKGQVMIGNTTVPQTFSLLEIATTYKNGGLRLPQLTTGDRVSLEPAFLTTDREAEGLVIYNTIEKCIEFWNGDNWVSLPSPYSPSGSSPGPPAPSGSSPVFFVSILPSGSNTKAPDAGNDNTVFTASPLLCPENIVTYKWYVDNETEPRQSTPSNQFTFIPTSRENASTVYVIAVTLSGRTAKSDPVTVKLTKD